jgi:hypothetical protein
MIASATHERRVLEAVRLAAAGRIAIGLALTVMPRRLVVAMASEPEPSGSFLLFARTVGIRDALFGLGCLLATGEGQRSDLRRWLWIWAASDGADVVAATTAVKLVGRSGAVIAAAAPLPFISVDVWALRRLRRLSALDHLG